MIRSVPGSQAAMSKLVAAVMALCCMRTAIAQAKLPTCLADTEYQDQPIVFKCYGAPGITDNYFMLAVAAGSDNIVADIPVGTINFRIEFDSPVKRNGYFSVVDNSTQSIIFDALSARTEALANTSTGLWHKDISFQSMIIGFDFYITEPRREVLTFTGMTEVPLQLKIKHTDMTDDVYRFKYSYDRYNSTQAPSDICQVGGHALGCMPYYGTAARGPAVDFSEWLNTQWNTSESAWLALWDNTTGTIPYYRWCGVWRRWPLAPTDPTAFRHQCWKTYKFVSYGGMEAQVAAITRTEFEYLYRLPKTDWFARQCCQTMMGNPINEYSNSSNDTISTTTTVSYNDSTSAWAAFQAAAGYGDPSSQLWDLCKELPYAPTSSLEYINNYLNTDGFFDLQAYDIEYCWKQPPSGAITKQGSETVLSAGVLTGDRYLPVADIFGFHVGHEINIDVGSALVEVKMIAGFRSSSSDGRRLSSVSVGAGYIWLASPLFYSHSAGAAIASKRTCHPGQPQERSWTTGVWVKNIACVASFTYEGKSYTGCTTVDRNHGWCSKDAVFVGNWEYCNLVCSSVSTTAAPIVDADASSPSIPSSQSKSGSSSSSHSGWMNWKEALLIGLLLCCMCICCITACVLCAMADKSEGAGQLELHGQNIFTNIPGGQNIGTYAPMTQGQYMYGPVPGNPGSYLMAGAYPTTVYPGRY